MGFEKIRVEKKGSCIFRIVELFTGKRKRVVVKKVFIVKDRTEEVTEDETHSTGGRTDVTNRGETHLKSCTHEWDPLPLLSFLYVPSVVDTSRDGSGGLRPVSGGK